MELFYKLLFCFAGVCAFAFLFRAPLRLIPVSGVIGTLGYALYYSFLQLSMPDLFCFFTVTLFLSLLSEFGAILFKTPATVFLSTSIFVLVPGLDLYRTVSLFVFGDFVAGAQTGVRTFLIVGAMAMAIAFSTLLVRLVKNAAAAAKHK